MQRKRDEEKDADMERTHEIVAVLEGDCPDFLNTMCHVCGEWHYGVDKQDLDLYIAEDDSPALVYVCEWCIRLYFH